ncbi:MAG: cold shock and DUF1294 domain-containing protein [Emcibacteraceae bacterium]|nr:cold shock and DUF1294 domain-containing protein [Emcibacteraceae bacterium]
MYLKGTLTTWNDEKGFGFITPNDGSKQIFIHAKGFYYRNKRPFINQRISYTISQDKNGRNFATEQAFNEAPVFKKKFHNKNLVTFIFPLSFILSIGFMALIAELPMLVFYYYITLSILTFVVYRVDKMSAKYGQQRTPENTLHFLSLIGGWPGALFAQQKFRHKTKKLSFLIFYWVTVIINCAGLLWLLTPQGIEYLHSFLGKFV